MADPVPSLPPFPDSERVVYRRNPLVAVICQLRFPPILRITTEVPAAFQEQIRKEFPLFSENAPEIGIEGPPGMPVPPALLELVKGSIPKGQRVGYDFKSADGTWKVRLTRDFLSLSTNQYTRWEEFQKNLEGPLKALEQTYSPAFFTRVGLRSQDLIRRSQLGFSEATKWSTLIQPHIAGVYAVPELENAVKESMGQLLLTFPEFKGKVRMNYGIAQVVGSPEDCFLIDSDYYTEERTKRDGVDATLAYFNKQSGRLFRWCIEPALHNAMEPEPVKAAD